MNRVLKFDSLWPFAVAGTAFALFCLTLCRVVYPGDNGELATAAALLEIAHPPGYPLLMCLGRAAVWVFGFLSPILALNLTNAAFGAGAIALLYQTMLSLSDEERGISRIIAAATSLLFAFGATAWAASTHFEVHALGMLLMAAFVFCAITAVQSSSIRHLILADFLFGLSLCNHLSAVALFPLLLAAHWQLRKLHSLRIVSLMLPIFLAPLLLYLYLPFRAPLAEVLTWNGLDTFAKVRDHMTAAAYRQYLDAPGFADLLPFGRLLMTRLCADWIFLAAPLAGLGLIALWNRRRWLAVGLCLSIALNLAMAFFYTIPDIESYLLPSLLISALLIGVSLNALAARTRIPRYVIPLVTIAAAIASGLANYQRGDLSSRTIAAEYGTALLSEAPPQSLLLCASDYTGFPVLYLRYVEGLRPDVEVLGKLPTQARLQARLDLPASSPFFEIAQAHDQLTKRLSRPLVFTREPMAVVDDQFLSQDDFASAGLLTSKALFAVATSNVLTRSHDYLRRDYFDTKEAATAIGILLLAAERESKSTPELAERLRKRAVEIVTTLDNFALANELSSYLIRIGALSDARRLLESALVSPTLRLQQAHRLRAPLGSVYFDLGDFARAETTFSRRIEVDPTDPHARYHLLAIRAERLRASGSTSELAATYRQMLDIYPRQHEIVYRLGRALLALGDSTEARGLLEQCRAARYRPVEIDSLLGLLPTSP